MAYGQVTLHIGKVFGRYVSYHLPTPLGALQHDLLASFLCLLSVCILYALRFYGTLEHAPLPLSAMLSAFCGSRQPTV